MSQHVHLPKFLQVFNKMHREDENINDKVSVRKTRRQCGCWRVNVLHKHQRGGGVGGFGGDNSEKIFHFENVQDLMQLPLSHSLSLLSAGAKSHVSTASGCVDSFTNRNVKRHTQGGLRDKGELNGAGNGTNMAQRSTEGHVKTPRLF